jgi:hypothetical protein
VDGETIGLAWWRYDNQPADPGTQLAGIRKAFVQT